MQITLTVDAPGLELALTQLLNAGAIVPKLTEIVTQLQAVVPALERVQTETNGLLVEVQSLKDIIATMQDAPPELVAIANSIATKVQAIDQLVPDAPAG